MNKELTPLEALEERLHDLSYVLSSKEVDELKSLCYENSNSWCPLSDFFNDISWNTSKTYNKNQAYKDLWLIALIVLGKKKELKALEIIKDRFTIQFCKESDLSNYYGIMQIGINPIYIKTKKEYNLLKEVLEDE